MAALGAGADRRLGVFVDSIGRTTVVGEDDVWILDEATARRRGLAHRLRPLVIGESVRDWTLFGIPGVLYPYTSLGGEAVDPSEPVVSRHLWIFRTSLAARSVFGKGMADAGKQWYEHLEHYRGKLRTPLSIAFAFVATHNHFVFDRGGRVFNRSAPVIKLKPGATEDDHYALLGLLNSSVACFWMKQVFYPKAGSGMGRGIQPEGWMDRYEFDGTKIQAFPIPEGHVRELALQLDRIAADDARLLDRAAGQPAGATEQSLTRASGEHQRNRAQLIALQEELDWECYRLYGILAVDNG